MKRLLGIIIIACISVGSAFAQKEIHFYAVPSIGAMYYNGELTESSLPVGDMLHLSGGLGVQMQYQKYIAVTLGYQKGKLSGADSLRASSPNRNFFFRSRFDEVNLLFKVNLFNQNLKQKRRNQVIFRPGIILGLGYFWFNPQVKFGDYWLDAQPLGTEGQNVESSLYPTPYSLNAIAYKIGAEYSFRLSEKVDFNAYFIYSATNTDYIDDVGGFYPAYEDIITTPTGPLTAEFTYRDTDTDPGQRRPAGVLRGNPDTKDGFVQFGFNFAVRFTGEPRRPNRGRRRINIRKRSRF